MTVKIDGTEPNVFPRRTRSNTARPSSSVTIASPSIRNEWAGNAAIAAAASGKRAVKSFPVASRHDAEAVMLDFVNPT